MNGHLITYLSTSKIVMYCPQQSFTHLKMLFTICIISFYTFFPQLLQLVNQWFQVNINLISLQQNVFLATNFSEEIFFVTENLHLVTKYKICH